MSIYEYDEEKTMRQMKAEGYELGEKRGIEEALLEILGELGIVSERLTERIRAEKDLIVLKNWVKLAAKAESVQKFEERM